MPLALVIWSLPVTWMAVIFAALWPVWTLLMLLFESIVLGQRLGLTATQKAHNTMCAANNGDADAQYRLAGYFDRGEEGLHASDTVFEEASRCYEKAAVQGHSAAQFDFAEMLMGVPSGEPFRPDEMPALPKGSIYHEQRQASINSGIAARKRAAYWCQKAAEQGHLTAQGRLGEMYRTGNGVTRNVAIARQWLSKALAAAEVQQANTDDLVDVCLSEERKADVSAWRAGLDQLQDVLEDDGTAPVE